SGSGDFPVYPAFTVRIVGEYIITGIYPAALQSNTIQVVAYNGCRNQFTDGDDLVVQVVIRVHRRLIQYPFNLNESVGDLVVHRVAAVWKQLLGNRMVILLGLFE